MILLDSSKENWKASPKIMFFSKEKIFLSFLPRAMDNNRLSLNGEAQLYWEIACPWCYLDFSLKNLKASPQKIVFLKQGNLLGLLTKGYEHYEDSRNWSLYLNQDKLCGKIWRSGWLFASNDKFPWEQEPYGLFSSELFIFETVSLKFNARGHCFLMNKHQ